MSIPKTGSMFTEKRHDIACQFPKWGSLFTEKRHDTVWQFPNWIAVYRKVWRHSISISTHWIAVYRKVLRLSISISLHGINVYQKASCFSLFISKTGAFFAKKRHDTMSIPQTGSLFTGKLHVFSRPKLERRLPKSFAIQYCMFAKLIAVYRKASCYSLLTSETGSCLPKT